MIPDSFKRVILNLALVLALYQVIRLCFFLINANFFDIKDVFDYLKIVGGSMRFDLSVLGIINSAYIVFALLPFRFTCQKWYQTTLQFLFLIPNSVAFLFDVADIAYFPYQRKRMTSEVFELMAKKSDFLDLVPSYLVSFWYVPILMVSIISLFLLLNKRINKISYNINNQVFNLKNIAISILFWALSFLAIRGGFQLKPILTFNALEVASNQNVALAYNTTFSITHTLETQSLPEYSFFTKEELMKFDSPIQQVSSKGSPKNCNIVILILESFGKSYTGIGGRKSFTPFLDSIMHHGLTFTNAFANANISASGIPAVIASIPAFMDEPFTTSPYGSNAIDALPNLLSRVGYSTSFLHGGSNGTMSFDLFAKNAGFQHYYGRNEYANDKDYDGTWGIWDEPYLQYVSKQLSKAKEPFFSSVFTLSSHQPFQLPTKYQKSKFATLSGIERGVAYSDMALRKFFETASQQTWFKNTLFVITPDHNFVACHDELGYYNQGFGLYAIPIVFYKPNDPQLKGIDTAVFQQINILPTVLDYLNYPFTYFSFGRSAFDSTRTPFAYNYANHYNQFLFKDYLLTSNDTTLQGIFHFKSDSLLKKNLIENDSLKQQLISPWRAFLQNLNQSIRENKHHVKR